MAATMNNLELTLAVQELQAQMIDAAGRFTTAIPKIEQDVSDSASDIKIMFESLKAEFKPNIDRIAPTIETVMNMQAQINAEGVRLKEAERLHIQMVEDNKIRDDQVKQLIEDSKTRDHQMKTAEDVVTVQAQNIGVESQARVHAEAKVVEVSSKIEALYHEIEAQKRKQEVNYQQQQMQIATTISSSSSTGTHGPSPARGEPLATNKLLLSDEKIDGTESRQTLEDWFEDVAMKVNLVYPGSQAILDWAAQSTMEITPSEIARRADNMLATSLSLQMYVFLKCKTKASAANHLKTLSTERGLEGWRILRRELMGVDGPRQEEEFNAIADLPKLKLADMSKFENLIVRWESELKRHEAVNREYFIGKFRKRQIIYKSLPDEVAKSVDAEVAKGQLQEYNDFVEFIKSISKSSKFRSMPPPKPLSANLVTDEPEMPQYSHDDWIAYLGSDEGWQAYQSGEEVDQIALRDILSLVGNNNKGKGKGYKGKGWDNPKGGWNSSKGGGWNSSSSSNGGKGKGDWGKDSKGKGKGPSGKGSGGKGFNGNCHNCGVWGHRAYDCTEPKKQQQGVGYVDQYQNSYQNTQQMAFMVTDMEGAQVDYRQPWSRVGKSNFSPQLAHKPTVTDSIIHNKFGLLSEISVNESGVGFEIEKLSSDGHDDFPVPTAQADFHRKPRMPKLPPRKSQFMRLGCEKSCCDSNFNVDESGERGEVEKGSSEIKLPPCKSRPAKSGSLKYCDADFMSDKEFKSVMHEFEITQVDCCYDECCSTNKNNPLLSKTPILDQPKTEQVTPVDTSVSVGSIPAEASSDMASRMLRNMEKKGMPVSEVVRELAKGEVNLITSNEGSSEVLNVDNLVWVQVPCAVDSGACANVSPENIFKLTDATTLKLEPKFFGADGSPIINLGMLVAEGVSEEGIGLKIDFDLAKVTRPLLSVFKMTAAGHRVQFNEVGGFIQVKGSNQKIKLRSEGRLYMLDLWCQVPAKIAETSPFIRQVAKA